MSDAKVDKFFLPGTYQENRINITLDKDSGIYWDEERVKRSRIHQFAVYLWAKDIIRSRQIKTVVDVGCGFATKLAWLNNHFPNLVYYGVDQENAARLCRQNYNFGKWLGVNLEENPALPQDKADLVISSDVIEHFVNPDNLLHYFKRIVSPDGLILISTPERTRLRGADCLKSPNPYHIREWSETEFATYLQDRGFQILEHRILPAMKFELSPFYLNKAIRCLASGKTLRYNQAVLAKVSP